MTEGANTGQTMQPEDQAFRMTNQALELGTYTSTPIVTIYGDGRVELGPGAEHHYQVDEAARAFWDAVIAVNPLVAARDRIAALIAAGDLLRRAGGHADTCPGGFQPPPCPCGWDDAAAAWERAKER